MRVHSIGHNIPQFVEQLLNTQICETCIEAKSRARPSISSRTATSSLEYTSADLITKFPKAEGFENVLVVRDHFSGYIWAWPIRGKDEAGPKLIEWITSTKTLYDGYPKFLRVDQGESWTKEVRDFCGGKGVTFDASPAATSTSQAYVERANQEVERRMRSLLFGGKMEEKWWPYAADYAALLHNSISSMRHDGRSPHELLTGKKPDVSKLHVFGSVAFAILKGDLRRSWTRTAAFASKHLRARALRGIYLGFSEGHGRVTGHRLWIPRLKKVVVVRDVVFTDRVDQRNFTSSLDGSQDEVSWLPPSTSEDDESDSDCSSVIREESMDAEYRPSSLQPYIEGSPDLSDSDFDELMEQDDSTLNLRQDESRTPVAPEEDVTDDPASSASSDGYASSDDPLDANIPRHYTAFAVGAIGLDPALADESDRQAFARTAIHAEAFLATSPTDANGRLLEPTTLSQAQKRDDWPLWEEAIQKELDSLLAMEVWEVVDTPSDVTPVGCRYVFKAKLNADRVIARYKARLVAQGFSQVEGIDFAETFAPVARLQSVRIFLSFARHHGLEIHQMDVATAYLNGKIDRDVYMAIEPLARSREEMKGKCYRLKRSLYGLRQAGRLWHQTLHAQLIKFGYKQAASEPCIYTRGEKGNKVLLLVYVDDLLIAGAKDPLIAAKRQLAKAFKMTENGTVSFMLGIAIDYDHVQKTCTLSQRSYIEGIVERFGPLEGGRRIDRPAPPDDAVLVSRTEGIATTKEIREYASRIGALLWVSQGTRPDISFEVSRLARFSSNPDSAHFAAINKVLRYLRDTKHLCLSYGQDDQPGLHGYSDSDWGGNSETRRSTTGYIFQSFGDYTSWSSRLQHTVALSSVEAEYVALSAASRELIWIRTVVGEMTGEASSAAVMLEVDGTRQSLRSDAGEVVQDVNVPVLSSDSSGARAITLNPEQHGKTKHIGIAHHFVRQLVQSNSLVIAAIKGTENPADLLTKSLPTGTLRALRGLIRLDLPRGAGSGGE